MILHTEKLIDDYWKILNMIASTKNVQEEFFFIDSKEKTMYFLNGNISMKLVLRLEGKGENLIIPKGEFLNLLKFADKEPIELGDDHSYKVKKMVGVFNTNPKFGYMLDSIKAVFSEKFDFTPYFRFSPLLWTSINKASVFVNPEDPNPQYQCLHVKKNSIASSSMLRIYINKNINFDYDAILNSTILKYMAFINPSLTSIYKSNKAMMLTDTTLFLVFNNIQNVSDLPIYDDRFNNIINSLFQSSNIKFNLPSLLEGMNYISYYSKNKINNCTHIFYNKEINKVQLEVDSNKVEVDIISQDLNLQDLDFDFYYNNDTLLNILSKGYIGQLDEITLYSSSSSNIFGLQPGVNEYIILGKIINN